MAATGQMLAALLGWPQATYASKVELFPDKDAVHVTREVRPPSSWYSRLGARCMRQMTACRRLGGCSGKALIIQENAMRSSKPEPF